MHINSKGATRTVIITKNYAIKIPGVYKFGWKSWWQLFLEGLLANIQERSFSKTGWPELCPIVFSIPGGFIIIMRRATIFTEQEFEKFDYYAFINRETYMIPVEPKSDSFGYLDGRVVAVDYGT